jgi:hypothetical protein
MGPTSQLPRTLRYLGPVRKRLAALPPEEVDENMDTAMFAETLRRRGKGLTLEEATRKLQADRDELRQWLALPGNENDPLHFFYGYLLIASDCVGEVLKPPAEPTRCAEVDMQMPPNSAAEWQDGGLRVTLGRLVVFVCGMEDGEAAFDEQVECFNLAGKLAANSGRCEVVSVSFGLVEGVKMVSISTLGHGTMKTVNYALKVPGGCAFAIITSPGVHVDWSELGVEQYFGTIRITQKKGQTLGQTVERDRPH